MGNRRRARPPVDQHAAPGASGPLPSARPSDRVRGTIINCDPAGHAYLVATPQGRVAMPRIRTSPGDLSLIPNGSPVMVDYSLGEPYIVGVLPPEGRRTTTQTDSVTGVPGHGGDDPVLAANYGVTAKAGNEPSDLIPGDVVLRGPGTTSLSALHGNVAMLQGGKLAQVRAFGDSDAVDIITGIYRLVSWMGESKIINEDGKTSFVWRGGSDQLTQTGPDEERYPIRLDVGHTGDLINLEVCTPRGQTLFRAHIDSTGKLEFFAAGGVDHTQGGRTTPVRIAGARQTDVRGDDSTVVGGTCNTVCEANRRCSVSSNDELVVGQDLVRSAGRNVRLSANEKVVIQAGSAITLKSGEPDGVKLGRNPRFHAVNFETLDQKLRTFKADYDAFKSSVAAHIHPVVPGPTPGTYVSTPAVSIPSSPGPLDIADAKNQDVVL